MDNEFSRSIKYVNVSEIDTGKLTEYIQQSVAINRNGFKRQIKDKKIIVPEDLSAALDQNEMARSFFDSLNYGFKKDFVELVTTAKRAETRQQRIAKIVARCAGKRRLNGQYKK